MFSEVSYLLPFCCVMNITSGGKPVDDLWQEHVSDKDGLQVYAKAMQGLATGSWAGREGECRILWCVQTCKEYWSHRLELLLLKDLRRLTHNAPTLIQPTSMLPLSPPAVRELVDRLSSRPWQLLDVGSCYNPFLEWPQFMVTAIDIAPATEVMSTSHQLFKHSYIVSSLNEGNMIIRQKGLRTQDYS